MTGQDDWPHQNDQHVASQELSAKEAFRQTSVDFGRTLSIDQLLFLAPLLNKNHKIHMMLLYCEKI